MASAQSYVGDRLTSLYGTGTSLEAALMFDTKLNEMGNNDEKL